MPGSPCVIRIVTGGAVPTGADLVIKREDVAEHGDQIAIEPAAAARLRLGENIRFAGENAPAGKPIAEPGTLISPALAGAIATVGRVHVRVHQPLTIAIISTGDELVDVHEQPTPWQLRDSNGPALAAMFAPCPWVARVSSQRVVDDEPSIDRALQTAVEQADAVLLTGGVSAGHRDFVPGALARAGIQTVFHKLPQRPGRPVLAAVTADGRPVLALPGNPVSVLVTARRLALPAIMRRAGLARGPAPTMVRLINADDRAIPLWWHRPVRLSGPGEAMLIDMRSSGDIVGVAMSDGFVELPPQQCGPGPWPYFAWSVG
jgi:molybdopterin molybdotransferase